MRRPRAPEAIGLLIGVDLRARGSTRVRMTDFGVEPSNALFDLIRARNEVTILFDLLLRSVDLERYLRGEM